MIMTNITARITIDINLKFIGKIVFQQSHQFRLLLLSSVHGTVSSASFGE